jgi:hypothetical protein
MENQNLDYALDTMNRLKESTKGNKYFSPKFTEITINDEGNCTITRDWYEVYRVAAIGISKKHRIFKENGNDGYMTSITDDDTIADWLYQYDGDLGKLQKDYPKMELSEIIELMTWYTMCQQRAFSPWGNEFINKQTYK